MHNSLWLFRFRLPIFLISLVLEIILVEICSRWFAYDSLGSSFMPRIVGKGSIGIWMLSIVTFSLYVLS